MVKTDNDYHGVVMAQEDSEEQVQDFRIHLPAQPIHLFTRFLARSRERILEQQQLDLFHGRDFATPDHGHRRGDSKTIPFEEGL